MDTDSGYMFQLVLDILYPIDSDCGYMFRPVLSIS